jgi:purine-binding chemotaxis protein CheW
MAKQRRAEKLAPGVARAIAQAKDSPPDGERQFITFHVGSEQLAFRIDETAEIMRVPSLVHMPLGPASILGLANLRGTVLPVVSLRRLLGLDDTAYDDTTRIIVMSGAASVGFAVDRIDGLSTVPVNAIERGERGSGAIDPAVVAGVIKGPEGSEPIKLLAPEPLLKREFSHLAKARAALPTPISGTGEPAARAQVTGSELLSFVTFDLSDQEYSLPLEAVREIIPLPAHVSELGRAETAVLGVITLRDRLLPIVSLRALLGMAVDAGADGRKVVVVSVGDTLVGVVTDRTREIVRAEASSLDPAPALLTRGGGEAEIAAICRLDGGKRLVAVLSPDRLFRSDLVKRIMADEVPSRQPGAEEKREMAGPEEQFVVFCLGAQEYGMAINAVDEIARLPDHLTKLPKTPAFVEGIINLRGSVVPVVDLRRRFGVTPQSQSERQRVLVLSFAGGKTGFLVDDVSQVIKITLDEIHSAPELSAEQMRLIGRVANLGGEGRMILIVDPAHLLDQVEADVLEQFNRDLPDEAMSPT